MKQTLIFLYIFPPSKFKKKIATIQRLFVLVLQYTPQKMDAGIAGYIINEKCLISKINMIKSKYPIVILMPDLDSMAKVT